MGYPLKVKGALMEPFKGSVKIIVTGGGSICRRNRTQKPKAQSPKALKLHSEPNPLCPRQPADFSLHKTGTVEPDISTGTRLNCQNPPIRNPDLTFNETLEGSFNLVAEWIHFTLLGKIVPTIKLKV